MGFLLLGPGPALYGWMSQPTNTAVSAIPQKKPREAPLKAREAAIAAETRLERVFEGVLDQLNAHNSRLLELHDEIRASQPKAQGAVCLELYTCGPGCNGCPHPRWVQYIWKPKPGKESMMLGVNLDKVNKDPILVLPRGEHFKRTSALIREAKSILKARKALLQAVRPLHHHTP